ncbi:MAG: CapA family protein [Clostridia bacterium]|nr:CapA family protein [Clostridia bacterium]
MAVAKETQSFFDTFSTDVSASSDALPGMLTKWHNAALYLSERAADQDGAALYTALEESFERYYSTELPKDAAAFSKQSRAVLTSLAETLIDEEGAPSGRYPALDLKENGSVAMTLLRLWRNSERETGKLTVTYGGEVAMGDYIGASSYQDIYAAEGAKSPLKGLVPVFATDDLSMISLSSPLTSYTVPEVPATEAFRGSSAEAYAKHLKNAGVDLVLLSTCHIKDFGETGYADTKAALEKAGLAVAENETIAYFNTDAGKIAVVSYDLTERGDVRFSEVPKAQMKEARDAGAVLVVAYFHTAEAEEVSASLANTMRDAAANGADLVLASHDEAMQGILLGGEKETSLVLSPGLLSYAAKTEGGRDAFLFQQSFSVGQGKQAKAHERLVFAVNNQSVGKNPTYAPTIRLSEQGISAVQSKLTSALPNFRGRVTKGDLTYVCIED